MKVTRVLLKLNWISSICVMAPAKCAAKRRRTSGEDKSREGDEDRQRQREEVTATGEAIEDRNIASLENVADEKSPVVVFAHGAGAPSSSDWMIRWKNLLREAVNAIEVVTFDYPYISGKRKAPPKAEKLVEFHSEIARKTMAKYPGHPLILVGKSMGSRVSCMVSVNKDVGAQAVVCLGYPLKGRNGAVRDETLLQLTVPAMFVQGSKDSLCPLEKLDSVRKKMNSISELHVIEGGDHSFKIAKKHLHTIGSTQEEAENLAVQAISTFVSRILK